MPRAKRFFLPGYIYHITHRCHNRVFLLEQAHEKKRWLYWISRSIKKYKFRVLTYCLTDNHVHLIAHPEDSRTVIAKSMHLVAGRVGQEFNERMKRKGAFWEDRYHATAVQSNHHLLRCMLYVDLNMVRAGVVNHPEEWPFCGLSEMTGHGAGVPLIDRQCLIDSVGADNWDGFLAQYRTGIGSALADKGLHREESWTRSIAVGDRLFVESFKSRLAGRARFREIADGPLGTNGDTLVLREPPVSYGSDRISEEESVEDNLIRWDEQV